MNNQPTETTGRPLRNPFVFDYYFGTGIITRRTKEQNRNQNRKKGKLTSSYLNSSSSCQSSIGTDGLTRFNYYKKNDYSLTRHFLPTYYYSHCTFVLIRCLFYIYLYMPKAILSILFYSTRAWERKTP